MKELTPAEKKRAIELLDIIVRPIEDDMNTVGTCIYEAQELLGYERPKVKRGRSFYGVRTPKAAE